MSKTFNLDADISSRFRAEGNAAYKTACEETEPFHTRKALQKALTLYVKAYEAAGDDDERASAAKNCAVAASRLANIDAALGDRPATLVALYDADAVTYYSCAMHDGRRHKAHEWRNTVSVSYAKCVRSAIDHIADAASQMTHRNRTAALWKLIGCMVEPSRKADVFVEVARVEFDAGVVSLARKDYRAALYAFSECSEPSGNALMHAPNNEEVRCQMSFLNEDINFHQATAESLQAISTGRARLPFIFLKKFNC